MKIIGLVVGTVCAVPVFATMLDVDEAWDCLPSEGVDYYTMDPNIIGGVQKMRDLYVTIYGDEGPQTYLRHIGNFPHARKILIDHRSILQDQEKIDALNELLRVFPPR